MFGYHVSLDAATALELLKLAVANFRVLKAVQMCTVLKVYVL